ARFVDLDGDRDTDLVVANDKLQGVWRFDALKTGWQPVKLPEGFKIPLIAREGINNGAWFHSRHLWVQNEHTQRLPDHVERCSYSQLLGEEPKKTATAPITPTDRSSAPGSEATAANLAQFPAAKTPEQALATFQLPVGLKLELVAAEPLVVDPVAFDWGPDGRLWVVEMRDYPRGLDGAGQPGGRVKVLTDTNGDGKYDDARIFLDDLPFPTGIKVWRKGVIVTAAPEVIYAEDTNGDHQADIKQTLYRGFGEGNQQHRVNGLRWNNDGWLYLGNGDSGGRIRSLATQAEVDIGGRDLRIRPDTGELDAISGQTQYSLCFNEAGDRFGGNNSQPVWHYVLEDNYLRRNPNVAPPAARKNVPRQPGNAPIFPTSKTITRFNDYGTANRFTSACGIEIYRDKLLGEAFHGNSFVCEPVHNLVHREQLEPAGVSFTSRRAAEEQEREFLSSSDNWFRPVMARTGPDGALYIADMYRLVIEHPTWIPVDWQEKLDLRAGSDKGRIYRVVRADQPTASWPKLSALDAAKLVALLESSNGTLREMVQQQLIWNNDRAAIEPLQLLARSSRQPYARLQALCTLDHFEALSVEQLLAALSDEHPAVRRQAARLCEARLNKETKLGPALLTLLEDADMQVAVQAACSLGEWRDVRSGPALGKLLEQRSDDAFFTGAVLSSVNDANRGAFLASLAAVPTLRERWIEPLLQSAIDAREYATVAQLVSGLEVPSELTGRLTLLALVLDRLERGPWPNQRYIDDAGRQVIAKLFAEAGRVVTDEKATKAERLAALKLLKEQVAARRIVPDIDGGAFLRTLIANSTELEMRVAAIQSLTGTQERVDVLRPLLNELTLDTPPDDEAMIVKAICESQHAELMSALLRGWRTRTPAQRMRIFETLLNTTAGTDVVLRGLAAKTITAEQLGSAQRQRLLSYPIDELRTRAKELLAHDSGASRAKIVEQYGAEALNRTADAQRGQVAFEKTCANCHKLNGVGHIVGPDLAALTDRSPQTLLIAMLDPNRAVEDKFREYLVLDHDGKLISGIVTSETGTSLTILAAAGKEHQVLRKDIDTLRASEKSLMPEGLERELTPQVCADIIAYVRASGSPAKKFAGNDPQLVKASADGVLELSASTARIYGPKLVFEPKYLNLGYWLTEQDQAVWSVEIKQAGSYRVTLEYACQASAAGDKFQLRIGEQVVSGVAASTGTWDDYKQQEAEIVRLKPGEFDVQLRSTGAVREALFDLRKVTLKRVGP
ncbi:MAG TPA: PVC-type heme-binding CxxCH protein, partial [Pirellulaceae bacterium]|nr:PVC-type heme-binding CxxCH protein [Pirellulaceae bacterium]